MAEDRKHPSGQSRFDTTQWSVVVAAGDSRNPRGQEALATLCRDYWHPVYSYVRSRGHEADAARDLTQSFFARFLEKGSLKQARQERGRFRSFLLASVKNFLANERDREHALRRGGGVAPLSLEIDSAESKYNPAHRETPEKIFERRWALTVLEQVLARLELEMERNGHRERFMKFRPFLTDAGGEARYRQIADGLDMSEAAVKVAIHRLRHRFGELLRQEVAETVNDPSTVDSELRYLLSAMSP